MQRVESQLVGCQEGADVCWERTVVKVQGPSFLLEISHGSWVDFVITQIVFYVALNRISSMLPEDVAQSKLL